jgi:hypothetical protein
MFKECNKCKELKEFKFFYKSSTCKDGIRGVCIDCISMQKKEKYNLRSDEKKQKDKNKKKEWANENKEKIKQYYSRRNNSENGKKYIKEYHNKNNEEIKKYKKEWHKKNREKILLMFKEYRKTEMYKISLRASAHNLRTGDRRLTSKLLISKLELQNCCCFYCNKELNLLEKYSVHIDHVIPIKKGGDNSIENIVWSCALCNLKKGIEER